MHKFTYAGALYSFWVKDGPNQEVQSTKIRPEMVLIVYLTKSWLLWICTSLLLKLFNLMYLTIQEYQIVWEISGSWNMGQMEEANQITWYLKIDFNKELLLNLLHNLEPSRYCCLKSNYVSRSHVDTISFIIQVLCQT